MARGLAVASLTVAVGLLAAAIALAAVGPRQQIPNTDGANAPGLAVDAAGNATALVIRGDADQIAFSDRPAGGAWSAAADIAGESGATHDATTDGPVLRVNAGGAAVAYWYVGSVVHVGYRASRGSPWEVRKGLTSLNGSYAIEPPPQVAVSPGGDALVAWVEDSFSGPQQVVASVRPAGGTWLAPELVGTNDAAGTTEVFDAAFTSDNRGAVLWGDQSPPHGTLSLRSGTTWNTDVPLPSGGTGWTLGFDAQRHQLEPLPGGALAVLFKEYGPSSSSALKVAVRPAGASFGSPSLLQQISGPGTLDEYDFASSPAGDLAAVWNDQISGNVIRAARRGPDGAWHPSQAVTAAEDNADRGRVAIDADGTAAVTFYSLADNGRGFVRIAERGSPLLGAAEPIHPAQSDQYDPFAAVIAGGGGTLLAAWPYLGDSGTTAVESAVLAGEGGGGSPTPDPGGSASPEPSVSPSPTPSPTPAVTDAKATCKRRKESRKPCRIKLTFAINVPATVKITVLKKRKGKFRKLGSLSRSVAPPKATITLRKAGKKRIGRGRYRIRIAAPGAAAKTVSARVR